MVMVVVVVVVKRKRETGREKKKRVMMKLRCFVQFEFWSMKTETRHLVTPQLIHISLIETDSGGHTCLLINNKRETDYRYECNI